MDLNKEVKKLKYLAETEIDIPLGSIDLNRRLPEHCIARQVVACIMLVDLGMKPQRVADYFNRHRTSFYFYKKEHITFMANPKIYPKYNELYNRVRYLYFNDEETPFTDMTFAQKLGELEDVRKKIRRYNQLEQVLINEIDM